MHSRRSSSPRALPTYLLFGIILGSAKGAIYEQGARQTGDLLTFSFMGEIPAWMNKFEVKVAHNKNYLERVFNYFRVEIGETSTPLKVIYDTEKMYVMVQVQPESFNRVIIMTGYALPIPKIIETTPQPFA